MPANSLLMPDGTFHNLAQKDEVPLTRAEIQAFSHFEAMHHKFDIVVFCKRCQQPIKGQNSVQSQVLVVSCQCREFVFRP